MPNVERKFSEFADNFVEATEELATTLGIPAEAVTEQKTQHTAYIAAFNACKSPNAEPIDHEERREKRNALELVIRKLKNAYIDGDPKGVVTNEIRMRFGLPPKDTTHTPVNPPTETPSFNMDLGGYLNIVVRHSSRPNNYSGAVLFYRVSDEPVTSHKDLTTSKLLTRIKEMLVFEDAERLKTLYAALCWQNEKGQLGPPSPIQSIIIV
jgi:hypothetical protein